MGVLRVKVDGSWTDVPPGPSGPAGPQGIQGPIGPVGPDAVYVGPEAPTGVEEVWYDSDAPAILPAAYVDIIPAAGFQAVSGYPPRMRLEGSRCYLEGAIQPVSGNLVNTSTLANLPAGYRPVAPTTYVFIVYIGVSTGWGRLRAFPNGNLILDAVTVATGTAVFLDPIQFSVRS